MKPETQAIGVSTEHTCSEKKISLLDDLRLDFSFNKHPQPE